VAPGGFARLFIRLATGNPKAAPPGKPSAEEAVETPTATFAEALIRCEPEFPAFKLAADLGDPPSTERLQVGE
jgi:hypothetical protein